MSNVINLAEACKRLAEKNKSEADRLFKQAEKLEDETKPESSRLVRNKGFDVHAKALRFHNAMKIHSKVRQA